MKSPAETVANNEDLLAEILLNLPPRSLIRFKSICKTWKTIISDRQFSHRHYLHHHSQKVNGFLLHYPNQPYLNLFPIDPTLPISNLQPPINSPNSNFTILQSCNGLFLLLGRGLTNSYYVYNPTTNRCAIIPPLPPPPPSPRVGGGSVGEAINSLSASLAFKDSTDQYIIVHVRASSASPKLFEIQIYDSSIGHWIQTGEEFAAPFGMSFFTGVYWNKSILWFSPNGKALLRFRVDDNTDGQQVEMIPLIINNNRASQSSSGTRRQRLIQESEGRLFMIETYGKSNPLFDVMEMKPDCSGWDVKYKVDISGIIDAFPEMVMRIPYGDAVVLRIRNEHYYAFQVCSVVVTTAEEDDDILLVLRIPGKLIGYTLKEKRFQVIREVIPRSATASLFELVHVFPFNESLNWV